MNAQADRLARALATYHSYPHAVADTFINHHNSVVTLLRTVARRLAAYPPITNGRRLPRMRAARIGHLQQPWTSAQQWRWEGVTLRSGRRTGRYRCANCSHTRRADKKEGKQCRKLRAASESCEAAPSVLAKLLAEGNGHDFCIRRSAATSNMLVYCAACDAQEIAPPLYSYYSLRP